MFMPQCTRTNTKFLVCLAVIIAGGTLTYGAGASFQGIGGDNPEVTGVSSDGLVVVGYGKDGAFRWTQSEGLMQLGTSSEGYLMLRAEDVSGDGTMVVGYMKTGWRSGQGDQEACIWTPEDGVVGLGNYPNILFSTFANGISDDGSVIAGFNMRYVTRDALLWRNGQAPIDIGVLPGTGGPALATGVSGDGSTVVGYCYPSYSSSRYQAYRWTQDDGMIGLGYLPGEAASSAMAASFDGSVIVGRANIGAGVWRPFRWTEQGGMESLGCLPDGGRYYCAFDVSADGSVVVGTSGEEAFLWNEKDGMQSIQTVLVDDYGLDLTGWSLDEAKAISADGRTIVGIGRNPYGETEAWRAVLPESIILCMDIMPGSSINPINPNANGVLPVTIFGSDELDVAEIDLSTLLLQGSTLKTKGNGEFLSDLMDVDGDSLDDLVLHFKISELQLESYMSMAELTGQLYDGTQIVGSDTVHLVGEATLRTIPADNQVSQLSTVPEPATLGLVVLGGVGLLRRRYAA